MVAVIALVAIVAVIAVVAAAVVAVVAAVAVVALVALVAVVAVIAFWCSAPHGSDNPCTTPGSSARSPCGHLTQSPAPIGSASSGTPRQYSPPLSYPNCRSCRPLHTAPAATPAPPRGVRGGRNIRSLHFRTQGMKKKLLHFLLSFLLHGSKSAGDAA